MRTTHPFSGGSYTPGDQWDECARCGFDYLRSQLVEESETKLRVCPHCVDDPKHYELPKRG